MLLCTFCLLLCICAAPGHDSENTAADGDPGSLYATNQPHNADIFPCPIIQWLMHATVQEWELVCHGGTLGSDGAVARAFPMNHVELGL